MDKAVLAIGGVFGLIVGVGIGIVVNYETPCNFNSVAGSVPAGATFSVQDCSGRTYYTNGFSFDEKHKCVIFVDRTDNGRNVVCGNYKMKGL